MTQRAGPGSRLPAVSPSKLSAAIRLDRNAIRFRARLLFIRGKIGSGRGDWSVRYAISPFRRFSFQRRRVVPMGPSKPVDLATRSFERQGEATAFFRAMLSRYRPGERIAEEDSLDLVFLLERHAEYVVKVGCGLSHFEVMLTAHGTQCFRIVRTDGSGTDFSYRHCVSQCPPSRKQEVSQAFRRLVRFDLNRARDTFFAEHVGADGRVSCAETGERLTHDAGHMDHRPPMTFEVIVTTFLAARGIALANARLAAGPNHQVSFKVADEGLGEAFRAYHATVARLDFVKKTVNLAQARRDRLKRG
jgi:Protein of unknown function (DUF3223)